MFHQRCHSAVDCSLVAADYVGLSSASVDVTDLAADHEDTCSSQTIVVRSVAATGASVRTRARGHRRCIGRRQQSLFDLSQSATSCRQFIQARKKTGQTWTILASSRILRANGWRKWDVSRSLGTLYRYINTVLWWNSTDSVKYTLCLADCLMVLHQEGDFMQGSVFSQFCFQFFWQINTRITPKVRRENEINRISLFT